MTKSDPEVMAVRAGTLAEAARALIDKAMTYFSETTASDGRKFVSCKACDFVWMEGEECVHAPECVVGDAIRALALPADNTEVQGAGAATMRARETDAIIAAGRADCIGSGGVGSRGTCLYPLCVVGDAVMCPRGAKIAAAVKAATPAADPIPDSKTQGDGWRDIATAPKDGRTILLADRYCNEAVAAMWVNDRWVGSFNGSMVISSQGDFGTDYQEADYPSHWQPLPFPPAPSKSSSAQDDKVSE